MKICVSNSFSFLLIFSILFFSFTFFFFGENFYVSTVDQLRNAIAEAAMNDEDDAIYLSGGEYHIDDTLVYYASGDGCLDIGPENSSELPILIWEGSLDLPMLYIDKDPGNNGVGFSGYIGIRNIEFVGAGARVFSQGIHYKGGSTNLYIEGCSFRDFNASEKGGGIIFYNNSGNVVLDNNYFNNNSAQNSGGGIWGKTSSGDVDIFENVFEGNNCKLSGGAVYLDVKGAPEAKINFSRNVFRENKVTDLGDGGGVYLNVEEIAGHVVFDHNFFTKNHVYQNGGGVYVSFTNSECAATLKLNGNKFFENGASKNGGGVCVVAGENFVDVKGLHIFFTNNLFYNNDASNFGAGTFLFYAFDYRFACGYIDFINNTYCFNHSGDHGGGIEIEGWNTRGINIYNNIFWKNSPHDFSQSGCDDDVFFYVHNNDFHSYDINPCSGLSSIESNPKMDMVNNIDVDPYFFDVDGKDFHLSLDSPCWNSGDSNAPYLPSFDMDDGDRVIGENVDMGAYEQQISNLSINMSLFSSSPVAGEDIIYLLRVENGGSSIVNNVVIRDVLPDPITDEMYSLDGGATYHPFSGKINIGNLSAGGIKDIYLRGHIEPFFSGEIENEATVDSYAHDTDISDNLSKLSVSVVMKSDMEISTTVSPELAIAGEDLTFNLKVLNNGPSYSKNIVVKDVTPSEMENVLFSMDGGSTWSPWVGSINLNQMENGTYREILLRGRVLPDVIDGSTIKNVTSVFSDAEDENLSNNSHTLNVDVKRITDLKVSEWDNPDPVIAGEVLTYSIKVENLGPSYSSNVHVVDPIFSDAFSGGITYSTDGGINWNPYTGEIILNEVRDGEIKQLLLKGKIDQNFEGAFQNSVDVYGNEYDPVEENNYATEETTVISKGDLEVSVNSNSAVVISGEELIYNLMVKNNGPSASLNIEIIDKIPSELDDVSYFDGAVWRPWGGKLLISKLLSGEGYNFSIRGRVKPSTPDGHIIFNKAVVESLHTEDDFRYNNLSILKTKVNTLADLIIEKSCSQNSVIAGESLLYKITVRNSGPSNARNVKVEDMVPPELKSLIFYVDGSFGGNWNGDFSFDVIRAGDVKTLTLKGMVDNSVSDGTVLKNHATVVGDDSDPHMENNDSLNNGGMTETVVKGIADLEIKCTSNNYFPESGDILSFKIEVINHGPDDCREVYVRDVLLPDVFNFIESNSSQGNYDPSTYIWNVGNIDSGEVATLSIKVSIHKNGKFRNISYVYGGVIDPDTSNNVSCAILNCDNKYVDISVSAASSVLETSGGEFIYHVNIRNLGNETAHNVVISSDLDDLLSIENYSLTSGRMDIYNGKWFIDEIGPKEVETLDLTVSFSGGETVKSIFYLSDMDEKDIFGIDDSSVVILNGGEEFVDISVVESVNNGMAYGVVYSFIIRMKNKGKGVAHNVSLIDVVPAIFQIENVYTSKGNFNLSDFSWTIDEIFPGEDVILILEVKPVDVGSFLNSVKIVSMDENDVFLKNNEASISGYISGCDLKLSTWVDNRYPYMGEVIKFTGEVGNLGPGYVDSADIFLGIPDEFDILSYEGDGVFDTGLKVWTLSDIASGESRKMDIFIAQNRFCGGSEEDVISKIVGAVPDDENGDNNVSEFKIFTDRKSNSDLFITTDVEKPMLGVGETTKIYVLVGNNGEDIAFSVMGEFQFSGNILFEGDSGGDVSIDYPYFYIDRLLVGEVKDFYILVSPLEVRDYRYLVSIVDDFIQDDISYNNYASGRFSTRTIASQIGIGGGFSDNLQIFRLDINGDGRLNILDLYLLREVVVGNVTFDEENLDLYDVNGDGSVNSMDIVILSSYLSSKMF